MSFPAEEHRTGFLDLKAEVVLALPSQTRTFWIQAGGFDLGLGTEAAVKASSHFAGRQLHCSLIETEIFKLRDNVSNVLSKVPVFVTLH